MQPEQMKDFITMLSASQELVERSSFDCINQHDKVANLISQLMQDLENMMSKLEAMNYTVEDIIESLRQTDEDTNDHGLRTFSGMLEEQGMLLIDVSQRLQNVMDEEEKENEVIHQMELDIAKQREVIDNLNYINE